MRYYRLYLLDPVRSHIVDVHHFEAPNDLAAVQAARANNGNGPKELWNLDRKIMDIVPRAALRGGSPQSPSLPRRTAPPAGWRRRHGRLSKQANCGPAHAR